MDDEFPVGRILVDFRDLARCSVCQFCVFAPASACMFGKHAVCPVCVANLNSTDCPVCPAQIGKNHVLDRKLEEITVTFQCRNRNEGCQEMTTPGNTRKHLAECEFRRMECNILYNGKECGVTVSNKDELIKHWEDSHNLTFAADNTIETGTDKTTISVITKIESGRADGVIKGIKVGQHCFVLRLAEKDGGLCLYLMYCGKEKDDKNLYYTVVAFGHFNNAFKKMTETSGVKVLPVRNLDMSNAIGNWECAFVHWSVLTRMYPTTGVSVLAKFEIEFVAEDLDQLDAAP